MTDRRARQFIALAMLAGIPMGLGLHPARLDADDYDPGPLPDDLPPRKATPAPEELRLRKAPRTPAEIERRKRRKAQRKSRKGRK